MRVLFVVIAALLAPTAALAYIGPGAGISLLGSIIGFVAAIFLGLVAVLAWPVRKMLKRRKAAREANQDANPSASNEAAPEPSSDRPADA